MVKLSSMMEIDSHSRQDTHTCTHTLSLFLSCRASLVKGCITKACEEFYCRSFLPAAVRLHNSISSSGPHTQEYKYKYFYYCVDGTSANIDNDVIFLCMVFVKKQKKFLKNDDRWNTLYDIWFRCSWQWSWFLSLSQRESRGSGQEVRAKDWRKLTVQPAARRMSSWVSSATWGSWPGNGGGKSGSCRCSHKGGQNACSPTGVPLVNHW